jgi:hypothetical protein
MSALLDCPLHSTDNSFLATWAFVDTNCIYRVILGDIDVIRLSAVLLETPPLI